ncbi:hypothetical protein ACFYVL_39910 [Streptomyces sp. NPDC004111]
MNNPLADVVGDLSDEQLRRIAALLRLRQLPDAPPQEERQAA